MANKLIRDGQIVANDREISETYNAGDEAGKLILPLAVWNDHAAELGSAEQVPGVLFESDEHPADFAGDFANVPVIAVNFPAFMDGRGFSIATLLRERYGYTGELRAVGSPIRDQLYYLKRCGFSAFSFDTPEGLEEAAASLNDFSNDYQRSANQDKPLFLRRN